MQVNLLLQYESSTHKIAILGKLLVNNYRYKISNQVNSGASRNTFQKPLCYIVFLLLTDKKRMKDKFGEFKTLTTPHKMWLICVQVEI